MYTGFIYEGGAHRYRELVELVEDLGGFIINVRILAQDATITFLIPEEDSLKIKKLAIELKAGLKEIPLVGTEIAVVSPSITKHHLPHPACDIAENLRRMGAKTNIIGLARGVGRRIAQITEKEKALIEEHDAAVFILGNFEYCLKEYKWKLFAELKVPVIATGGPEIEKIPYASAYVGGVGRFPYRTKLLSEIEKLDEIANNVKNLLDVKRKMLMEDPPIISPFILKSEIEKQVKEIKMCFSPAPVVPKLDGVRVKLRYDKFAPTIQNIKIGGYRLGDVSEIRKSVMRDYIIVKPYPLSHVKG